jgi:hypothetical protein
MAWLAGGSVWFLGAHSRVLQVLLGDYWDSTAVHGTGSTLESVPIGMNKLQPGSRYVYPSHRGQ